MGSTASDEDPINKNDQLNNLSNDDTSSSTEIDQATDDSFISDDEETYRSSQATYSSQPLNNIDEQILQLLNEIYCLMSRCRKLIKIIRNNGLIDQFIRNHADGPKNGFVSDIRVSFVSKSDKQSDFCEKS